MAQERRSSAGCQKFQQRGFVVATQQDEAVSQRGLRGNEEFKHASRVRSAVYVISEQHRSTINALEVGDHGFQLAS